MTTMAAARCLRSLCLLLLALNVTVLFVSANEANCVVGEDGSTSCPDDEQQGESKDDCKDTDDRCSFWAEAGECEENPKYMWTGCQKSCGKCGIKTKRLHELAEQASQKRDLTEKDLEETDWGVKQVTEGEGADKVQKIIDETEKYMLETVFKDQAYESVRDECKNRHENCAFWASIGECEANPGFMLINCAPVCQTCDQISYETRCPYDKNAPGALAPGDLNRLFETITTEDKFARYQPVIHSRPLPTEPAKNGLEAPDPQEGPWVVTMDSFLTEEECDRLIELGATQGYERSEDVGEQKFDGTFESFRNEGRTSTNAWCVDECMEDPVTTQVLERIENLTGIPDANSEFLQLLRYEKTQKYQTHHDYIEHQYERASGVRILTVFLYLSDVEEGGGTDFPDLGITVTPKKGKVLIWPSVLNESPDEKDPRTMHQALPVIRGLKYGANAWIHQRDFKEPYTRSCI